MAAVRAQSTKMSVDTAGVQMRGSARIKTRRYGEFPIGSEADSSASRRRGARMDASVSTARRYGEAAV